MLPLRLLPSLRHVDLMPKPSSGTCQACGAAGDFEEKKVLPDEIARSMDLSPALRRAFDRRESMDCPVCNMSQRPRQIARAALSVYGSGKERSLADLLEVESFR